MSQVVMVVRTTLTGATAEEYEAWADTAIPEIAMELGATTALRMWSRATPNLHISSYRFDSDEAFQEAEQNRRPAIIERVTAHWGDKVTREFEILDVAQFITTAPAAKAAE